MSGDRLTSRVAILVIGVSIAAIVLAEVAAVATSPELKAHVKESGEWCEQRNGELVNVQSLYKGGLHCQFENGTQVRMADIESQQTHDKPEEPDEWSVEAGAETPHEWRDGEITVRFERPDNGTWNESYSANVSFGEDFAPSLNRGERYRITVESHTGENRLLGSFEYDGEPEPLEVFTCCSDRLGERDAQ